LVNNWENGWVLPDSEIRIQKSELQRKLLTDNPQPTTTIVIVYLPQYLQYIGFLFLTSTIIYFIFAKSRRTDYTLHI